MFSFYQDRFPGVVTVGGGSPAYNGDGSYSFTVNIPSATSIRKAYLIAGRCGTALPVTVSLFNGFNTQSYTFNNANQVSPNFSTNFQLAASSSGVHAIDVTADISPSVSSYTITVPPQFPTIDRYTDFCLYIACLDLGMDIVDACIFLNDQNIDDALAYNLSFLIPMDVTKPVGLSLFTGYICNNNITGAGWHDPSNILVNATLLGRIGSTTGDGSCGGAGYVSPLGNFSYSNSILTAGANCNIDQAMSGLDCLSDIKALLPANCTTFNMNFNSFEVGNTTNNLWAVFVTYTDTTPYAFPYECLSCIPSSITTTLITQTSVRINWCPQGGIVNYANNVQYRIVGNTVWTVVPTLNVSLLDIAGLTANTNYEYQIVNTDSDGAVCAPSVIQDFTTLP